VTPEWEHAAEQGLVDVLARLLEKGADVNARNRHGQTALMIAATEGNPDAVTLLAAHGANLDCTAKYGLSALMIAVVRGHGDVVRALLAVGADQSIRGTGAPGFAGKTALDLARARGDRLLIEMLQARDSGRPSPLPEQGASEP
jgi:ankyrin repeat protein